MTNIDIFCEEGFEVNNKKIREALEKRLREQGITQEVEMSVSIVGEERMKELHEKYLETYETTDVISFPLEGVNYPDDILRLGDIVVCYPVAVKQASENNRSVDDEIDFLVDHSCLHLLGIHHD